MITTVAGNGTQGYSGDNGPATAATFFDPSSVALDASGNLFIDDSRNNVIREALANAVVVAPATLTVTASAASRTYGASDPTFTASYSGFVLSQTIGNSGVSGARASPARTAAPARRAAIRSRQPWGAWGRNYTFTVVNGTLTVNKATLTLTANNGSRAYGAADPTFTASYSGFVLNQTLGNSGVSGSPSIASTDNSASPVGSYTIMPAVGTLNAQNYTFNFANGTLSVTPVSLTVMANNASRAYGAAEPTFTASYSGFVLGQTIGNSGISGAPSFTSSDNSGSPVGSYTITPALGALAAQNYTFTAFSGATLTVNKATLTVSANSVSRTYGASDPAFVPSYSGFVLNQTLGNSGVSGAPSLTSTDSSTSPAGSYTITVALGSLIAQNYSFVLANGSLSVLPATLTVMANNGSRAYGASDPTFGVSYSGFVLNQTLGNSGVSGSPSIVSTDNSASPVGSYTITAALGTLGAQNYTFLFGSGVLTILPAPTTTVIHLSAAITYGQSETLTATVAWSGGTPTDGTVTFYDGATALGTASLMAGTVAITTGSLAAGSHQLTATYTSYSGNYLGSVSVPAAGPAFNIATVAGIGVYGGDNGPATAAELNSPCGIAVDSSGDLFIADTDNNAIRKINASTHVITTVAGTSTYGYSGDNGPATAAELYDPRGVAVDSSGDLFIADTYNNVIREVNASMHVITTVAGGGTAGYAATAARPPPPTFTPLPGSSWTAAATCSLPTRTTT